MGLGGWALVGRFWWVGFGGVGFGGWVLVVSDLVSVTFGTLGVLYGRFFFS